MEKIWAIFAVVLLVVFLLVIGPWVTFLALATIFGLTTQYTFWTWLSIVWLFGAFGGVKFSRS